MYGCGVAKRGPDIYGALGNDHAESPPVYGRPEEGTTVEPVDPKAGKAVPSDEGWG